MSEFCTRFYEKDGMEEDIDLPEIISELPRGERITIICEGCGYQAIRKDENGTCYAIYRDHEELLSNKTPK